ncbi:hypothetical protein OV208_34435 [Corallococcus sp. bb12-1]|uniref:ArsR family transcriptional regulator n=1 Tax=Corallococcus terminator TaxID=2316733 RepID=A0A3A8JF04_9BACT|nr:MULTISPECIES: hypothetical protein [Corallococcus]MCY1046454.1 hypothetical protein [Corallococcus sp. bb12-1]RKG90824.1 hypothetical protein D7V88_10390 [Corallococcus terminator]
MTDADLAPRVQRFLTAHIDSIEKLEVLLLLRARTDRAWTAPAVALELRITEASAARRLAELKSGGLLLEDGVSGEAFRFSPSQSDDVKAAAELSTAYAARRVSVIAFIFSRPMDRVRGV